MQAVDMHLTFRSRGQQTTITQALVRMPPSKAEAGNWGNHLLCKLFLCISHLKAEASSWVQSSIMQAVAMHPILKGRGQQTSIMQAVSMDPTFRTRGQQVGRLKLSRKPLTCIPPSKAEAGSWVEGTAWSGWGDSRPDSLVRPVSLSLVG